MTSVRALLRRFERRVLGGAMRVVALFAERKIAKRFERLERERAG